jgi:hypothetical protein
MLNGTQDKANTPQGRPQVNTPAGAPGKGATTPDQNAGKTVPALEMSKMQSTFRTKVRELEAELAAKETELTEARKKITNLTTVNEVLQAEVDSPYVDDATKTAAQKIRAKELALANDKSEFADIKTKYDAILAEKNEEGRVAYANSLAEKWGVTADDLLAYETPDEMDKHILTTVDPAALRGQPPQTDQSKSRLPTPPPPGFGPGEDWRKKSPEERVAIGLLQKSK